MSTPVEMIRTSGPLGPTSLWIPHGVTLSIDRLEGSVLSAVVDVDDPERAAAVVGAPLELAGGRVDFDPRSNPAAQDHVWRAALTRDVALDSSLPVEVERIAAIDFARSLRLMSSSMDWSEVRAAYRRAFELVEEAAATEGADLGPPVDWPGAWPDPAERTRLRTVAAQLCGETVGAVDDIEIPPVGRTADDRGPGRPAPRGRAVSGERSSSGAGDRAVLVAGAGSGSYEVAVVRVPERRDRSTLEAELLSVPASSGAADAVLLIVSDEAVPRGGPPPGPPGPGRPAAVGLCRPVVGERVRLMGDCSPRRLDVHGVPGRSLGTGRQPSEDLRIAATRSWLAHRHLDPRPLWELGLSFTDAGRLDQARASWTIGATLRAAESVWSDAVAAVEEFSRAHPAVLGPDPFRLPQSLEPPRLRWLPLAATAWLHGL